jgi:(p)ppGpp synthase/HD superfamily hydrolase
MIMKKGELLSIAIQIAVEAHAGQFDKGGVPYILHPLKVMHYTKSDDEEVMAIAVLHDAVEDNRKITYSYLRERGLTERIISGIMCLTKIPGESYEEYKLKVKSNPDSILVKKGDLRHNSDIRRLKGVSDKDIERIAKYQRFFLELEAASK